MPQSYGRFWLPAEPTDKVVGRLTWGEQRRALVELDEPPSGWMPFEAVLPVLHANVAGIGFVTLVNLVNRGISIGGTYQGRLSAHYTVTGVHFDHDDNDAFVRRVRVALPVLHQMLPTMPLTVDAGSHGRLIKRIVTINPGSFLWSSEDVEIEWVRDVSSTPGLTETTVRSLAYMHLTSSRPKSLSYWMDKWVYPVLRLLPILVGQPSDPTSLEMWQRKHLTTMQHRHEVFRVYAPGFGERLTKTADVTKDHAGRIANADDINRNPTGLAGVIEKFELLEQQHPVALPMLLANTHDPERPLTNRYIALTAALEAFDATRSGIRPISDETFKQNRIDLLGRAKTAGLDASSLKFLKRWLPGRSHYSLEARLRRLHTYAPTGAQWVDVGYQRMAEIRNAIAHGRETAPDQLQTAHDQALSLARHLVLCELGMRRF